MSTSKRRGKSKRLTAKQKREHDEERSRRYSTGYRFALYDPIDPDAPLRNCSSGECGKTFVTFTRDEIKAYREKVTFANWMLISAGAKYLVAIVPAAIAGFAAEGDGRGRETRRLPAEYCYDDDDDDDAGEEWKTSKGGAE